MAKDYKHRIRGKNTLLRQDFDPVKSLSVWKWMLITASVISAVVLVVYVSSVVLKKEDDLKPIVQTQPNPEFDVIKKPVEPEVKPIQYDFYTILSDKEVVVPEYEIKTRTREDSIGQAKETQYVMQAGSFNTLKDAEKMRLKLVTMGIESKIQKATVGDATRYRVKMGPFAQIASVNTINTRLKQNNIDAIVTEIKK